MLGFRRVNRRLNFWDKYKNCLYRHILSYNYIFFAQNWRFLRYNNTFFFLFQMLGNGDHFSCLLRWLLTRKLWASFAVALCERFSASGNDARTQLGVLWCSRRARSAREDRAPCSHARIGFVIGRVRRSQTPSICAQPGLFITCITQWRKLLWLSSRCINIFMCSDGLYVYRETFLGAWPQRAHPPRPAWEQEKLLGLFKGGASRSLSHRALPRCSPAASQINI